MTTPVEPVDFAAEYIIVVGAKGERPKQVGHPVTTQAAAEESLRIVAKDARNMRPRILRRLVTPWEKCPVAPAVPDLPPAGFGGFRPSV